MLISRPIREQAYRSCMGILRLADKYGSDRMEEASLRTTLSGLATYKSVEAILKNGLDRVPLPNAEIQMQPIDHENIRGADYYREHGAREEDHV